MPKSTQISGFNVAARNYQDLTNEVINLGGGDDEMNRIHTDRALRRQLADLIVGNAAGVAPGGTVVATLEVVVDHGKSVDEMVKAGSYNDANDNITGEHFPHPREGEETVTIDLVKFDQVGTTAERERKLAALGELAEMDDMLALGAQHPDQQRQHPIVFLGSAWMDPDGSRYVGCLWGVSRKRRCRLYLDDPDRQWSPDYVFAVRCRK